ncbi:MAG: hypothetical protein KAU84_04315, partial [Thermoplasmatales archaeon]|nr:hypothetical protein [Thermoplasmatales archaeon]
MVKRTLVCPNCKNKVTIQGDLGEKIQVICPNCKSKGIFTFPKGKSGLKTTDNSFAIEVRGLAKSFNNFKAVDDVSFNVKTGEIFGFL